MAIKESVGSSSKRLRLKEQDISGARVPAPYSCFCSTEGGKVGVLLLTCQAEVQQEAEEGRRAVLGEAQSRNT